MPKKNKRKPKPKAQRKNPRQSFQLPRETRLDKQAKDWKRSHGR